jgi:tetratricopeptide (TPR) repeat protein
LDGGKKDRVYRKIAQVHEADRDYRAAIDYLEKAASYAEKNKGEFQPDILWLEAANMAMEMDDTKIAFVYFRKALAYNPENLLARRGLEQLSRFTTMSR